MAQAWKCTLCGTTTTDPSEAGDHDRKYNGKLVWKSTNDFGKPIHYMEDLGE